MEIENLKDRWIELFQNYGDSDYIIKGFDDLVMRYSEKHRYYHTLDHVYDCLKAFDGVADKISDRFSIEVALWFHDVIYYPKRGDNEAVSAKHAGVFLKNTTIPEADIKYIEDLILLTKHPSAPSTFDEKCLIDIDLLTLGSDVRKYDKYEAAIRKEFSFAPSFLYKKGRKKVLKSFINSESIFQTDYFCERFESQALENLKRAVKNL